MINTAFCRVPKTLKTSALAVVCIFLFIQKGKTQECPLINAHAHNDYLNAHPLQDALANKFSSVEADVFLVGSELIISHVHTGLRHKKSLAELYLQPLLDSCKKNNGKVYKNCSESLMLLVDIKSDAENSYEALKRILIPYESILTKYENGIVFSNAVTIVLSGNKPLEKMKTETTRLAFLDQSLLGAVQSKELCPLASTKYSNVLTWKGKGNLPKAEKEKLTEMVNKSHREGKKVRLWASPENKEVWQELLACGVDLINTDKLAELNEFLKNRK